MIHQSIEITDFINKGYGLGQLPDGRKIMVRHALPGERVTAKIKKEKKNFLIGELEEPELPSAGRIEPACKHYGTCGGCDLQHASYELQLQLKRKVLIDLMKRQFRDRGTGVETMIQPTLPAPHPLYYRQRIRLQVNEEKMIGYLQHNSHRLVAVSACPIARPEINQVLGRLVESEDMDKLLATCRELELCWNPESGMVTLLLKKTRKPRPADFAKSDMLRLSIPNLDRIFFSGDDFPLTPASPKECAVDMAVEYPKLQIGGMPYRLEWELNGFCQVNLEQNQHLIEKVVDFADIQKEDTILDLYCGMGNFSLFLAGQGKSLIGVEGQGSAIRSARKNSKKAELSNTTFIKSPIHKICEKLVAEQQCFDCLIIDPPRQGVPGLAAELSALCRKRMVYISCDPATLCRDLDGLCKNDFAIRQIQPVDMFPQTHHIETLVLLEKN
ncbi:class I SAM-dependent RNA methyltransferase [Desulfopila sp. IMCC35008]|uniref:class I SAM-dependent RNA methyltransferase n=1 Tax=Desulfopila sp. IMCC35008 TaxID=2653858 RepID=UPI0013D2BCE3|nr:class I SAM-dependent RNA methyltransferase [Desulfopila sp. IMCC35008]